MHLTAMNANFYFNNYFLGIVTNRILKYNGQEIKYSLKCLRQLQNANYIIKQL